MAVGPNLNVSTWKGYDINNYSFYTKSQDDKSSVQNSGLSVEAHFEHFCSVSDNNPIQASMSYFGVIEEIWELDYIQFRVPVFKCKWVNGTTGVHREQLGFTLVDLNKVGYKDKPFINKSDRYFTSKIRVIQHCEWFYKEDQLVSMTIMMIQHLTFVTCLLFPQKILQQLKKTRLMTYMQIVMIMMKVYGRTFPHNCAMSK